MKLRLLLLSAACLLPASAFAADVGRPAPARAPAPTPTPSLGLVIEGWGGDAFVGSQTGNVTAQHTNLADFAGSVRMGVPLGGGLGVQFDLAGEWTNNNKGTDNFDSSLAGGVHLSSRNSSGLFGVFGGAAKGTSEGDSLTQSWFIGLEGQMYSGNWIYYAQAGYFDANNHAESIYNAGFARGVIRTFLSANSSIQVEGSVLIGKQDDAAGTVQNGLAGGWGVRFDQQFAMIQGTSTTLFLGYRGGIFQATGDPLDNGLLVDHTIFAGLRLGFGSAGGDAKTNALLGVNLDLPDVGRWTGAGPIID